MRSRPLCGGERASKNTLNLKLNPNFAPKALSVEAGEGGPAPGFQVAAGFLGFWFHEVVQFQV